MITNRSTSHPHVVLGYQILKKLKELVRHNESGDSEDELPCVIGGEREG